MSETTTDEANVTELEHDDSRAAWRSPRPDSAELVDRVRGIFAELIELDSKPLNRAGPEVAGEVQLAPTATSALLVADSRPPRSPPSWLTTAIARRSRSTS